MRLVIALTALLFSLTATAQDAAEKIRAAMAADIRTEAEVARDRNRLPEETLGFFGLQDDMTVLELLPGGGWYTKLLAPVLRDDGKLYVSVGTNNVSQNLLGEDGFDQVEVLPVEFGAFAEGPVSFGVSDVDMALTFRNMHNLDEAGRRSMNAAVFDALKSGGAYGVVDHIRRHMEGDNRENRRRADVVQIILEVLDAGFEFEAWSDLHHRPDDELRYEVGRRTVTGNTDRFTLLFRKP